jgi:hypothetical protein
MQSTPRERLQQFAHVLQQDLFGRLEEHVGPLSDRARLVVAVLSAVPLGRCLPPSRGWVGRPAKDRFSLAAAFIAKAVYGIETTRRTIAQLRRDRQLRCICGWSSASRIPHEATFSRAFDEFSRSELPQHLHQAVIRHTQQGRLIGHIARDATAIEAREKFPEPPAQKKKMKHERRPKRAQACEL